MSRVAPKRFQIGPLLGSGGFGEVYRATMRSPGGLDTLVALKVLHRQSPRARGAADRLRDEGKLLAQIRHPVVVQAFDLVMVEGRLALVTEFVEGLDLEGCFALAPPIPQRPMAVVLARVASALDAAWSTRSAAGAALNIVHRDIKPSNIRVGRDGQVRLLDFGIALFNGEDRHAHTQSDVMMGSLPYMAPERFVSRSSRPAVDVFGLGCCAFESLAGSRFFADMHLRELTALALSSERYEAHLNERFASIGDGCAELIALTRACLSYDPDHRPDAGTVAGACQDVADRIKGPSLQRWCTEAPWPEQPDTVGSLTGTAVPRDPLPSQAPPPPSPDEGQPRTIQRAPTTAEPAMVPGGGSMSKRRPPGDATPQAPPAFPSIPLGTALENLQLSEEEAAALRTPPPAPVATRPPPPVAAGSAAPAFGAPVAAVPPADGEQTLRYALLASGCLLAFALASLTAVAAVGLGAYALVVGG